MSSEPGFFVSMICVTIKFTSELEMIMDNPENYCVHCGQYGNPCACPERLYLLEMIPPEIRARLRITVAKPVVRVFIGDQDVTSFIRDLKMTMPDGRVMDIDTQQNGPARKD